MRRLVTVVCLLIAIPFPVQAAVTTNQLETVISSTPFRQRIEYAMVTAAEQISSEATSTANHAARARLATVVLNNPDNYVTQFAQATVVQLPLSTTNMVTVSGVPNADVDTTDATLLSDISAIWNALTNQ